MPIDPKTMRRSRGRFATGVTLITARCGDRVHGMTANSFASVSLDPPLVLWCAENGSRTLGLIQESGTYGVSILARDQEALAAHFATRATEGADRFEGVDAFPGPVTGCPLVRGALCTLECRLVSDVPAGDHHVLVAEVVGLELGEGLDPLLYFASGFRSLAAGS